MHQCRTSYPADNHIKPQSATGQLIGIYDDYLSKTGGGDSHQCVETGLYRDSE